MHWGKHHRTYVTNLNNQIKDKPLANKTLHEVTAGEAVFLDMDCHSSLVVVARQSSDTCAHPQIILDSWNSGSPTPEFNNAGQVFNHDFYWESMAPNGGGARYSQAGLGVDQGERHGKQHGTTCGCALAQASPRAS